MNYVIINKDCLKVLPLIKDKYADCVFTSIPYYHVKTYGNIKGELDEGSVSNYKFRLNILFKELYRILKDNGLFCLNVGNGTRIDNQWSIVTWDIYNLAINYFKIVNTVVWVDSNRRHSTSDKLLVSKYEPIFILSKTDNYKFNKDSLEPKYRNDVWEINYISGIETKDTYSHSGIATFSVELAMNIIKLCTNEDDIVLDPFLGSGTTMEASARLRRNCLGIDINRTYCENSYNRTKQFLCPEDKIELL